MKSSEAFYRPRGPEVKNRLERFDRMNAFVTACGGWITSLPGEPIVRMECLPNSTLPDDLRRAGYGLREAGEGQRILACAILERFIVGADGERKPVTAGSTRPIQTIEHAGIVAVQRYTFALEVPDAFDLTIR
jgi:hypothetical protein